MRARPHRYSSLREAIAARMSEEDFSACEVFIDLLEIGDLANRCGGTFLEQYGLNETRYVILSLLDHSPTGSLRSADLSQAASVRPATMTGLIDTLEHSGLLARMENPHDRRACCVKITKKGEELLDRMALEKFAWISAVRGTFSPGEQKTLRELLSRVRDILSRTLTPPNPAQPPNEPPRCATAPVPPAGN